MLLQQRVALIDGGGGSIGGAVSRAFARQGATVHPAGRTPEPLDRVAADIRAAGDAVPVPGELGRHGIRVVTLRTGGIPEVDPA